jgi:membrane-bound lytic murein transglycosylase D
MISALAFGYGVGMAAPDGTLDGMRTAVGSYASSLSGPQQPPPYPYPPGPIGYAYAPYGYPPGYGPAPYALAPGARGPLPHESSKLAALRQMAEDGGSSCKLPGYPNRSEAPRYASEEADDEIYDPDDLDPAGKDALSRLQLPDFGVAITRSALRYVRFLTRTTRGRDMFETWLKRSGRYTEMIQQSLRESRLPEDLIWVAMIESGFDPRARSEAGAVGLWQFMPSTGEVYGLEVTRFVDDRKNPIEATTAATHHLRDLHERFGSWDLAFAAYNMGYEQLLERIDRYGTTDFAELARQRALPSETAAYVPKIIAAALVANNLERYGFDDVKVYEPMHTAELSVPGGTPIKTIAKAAGISTSALQKYNPHLLAQHVPPGHDFVVYVPPESLSRARTALPAMIDSKLALNDAETLEPDDLFGLSGNEEKAKENAWTEDENLLRFLPRPKRRSLRNLLDDKKDADEAGAEDGGDDGKLGMLEQEFAPKRADRELVMYRVGPGDTLIGLAKQFAIDVDDLARDNGLDAEDMLREGALLKLSVKHAVLQDWKRRTDRLDKTVESSRRRSKKST